MNNQEKIKEIANILFNPENQYQILKEKEKENIKTKNKMVGDE